ncbi:MAG: siphovirus ReqiPepy6 Gp37-like family protein [Clostridia bacterium]|nr:siphovirus ReqiPepy6 Gp37-like family protein [Clostridia bacterium]
MDFNIHDQSGTWVGIVENPTSAIWTRRYQQPGDFELYLPATEEMLSSLSADCYISREDAPEVMMIEHVEIRTDADEGNYILVSGRGAECLLDRRIIWQQTAVSGRVDLALYRLAMQNAVSPTITARRLPLLMDEPEAGEIPITWEYGTINTGTGADGTGLPRFRNVGLVKIGSGLHITLPDDMRIHLYYYDASGAYLGYSGWHTVTGYTITPSTYAGASYVRIISSYVNNAEINAEAAALVRVWRGISAQYTGAGLLDAWQDICKAHGLGFRAGFMVEPGIFPVFLEIIEGKDRSEGQTVNSPVIFSAEFENLLSSTYVLDTKSYKNVALVAGEGEGKKRRTLTLGTASGLARRELYVDARDLSSNEGEITDLDYSAQLSARGAEKIAEHQITQAFNGEIDTANNFILDQDYSLGDIVTVENEYSIRKNVRVSAIMETWDNQGYTAIPTFENVEV